MKSSKYIRWLWLLLVVLCLALPGWLIYRDIRREQASHTLIEAINRGRVQEALNALKAGADPNARDIPPDRRSFWQRLLDILHQKRTDNANAPTALLLALENDDVSPALIQALVNAGADVNVKDEEMGTALMLAIERQNGTARLIAQKHARFRLSEEEGSIALLQAVEYGDVPLVQALLDKGADPNTEDDTDGMMLNFETRTWSYARRPALIFVLNNNEDDVDAAMLKAFLDKGANINARDDQGRTALMWTVFSGEASCFQLLLQRGADTQLRSKQGDTALSLAHRMADDEHVVSMIQQLKQAGAKE